MIEPKATMAHPCHLGIDLRQLRYTFAMLTRAVVASGLDSRVRALVALALAGLLCACASGPEKLDLASVPALQSGERVFQAYEVPHLVQTPELLAMDQEMLDFVDRYTGQWGSERQRLMSLHRSIRGSGMLDLDYDPFADGTGQDAFYRGTANCLSYAHMFVAMARESGLDASYQWVEMRPQWTRMGERVAVRLHVNVRVKLRSGQEYMADIDPLEPRDIADTRILSDHEAAALYHNNVAMDALAEGDVESAWLQAIRALQMAPKMSHLWVNLGAIYRHAGQHADAESTYLRALQINGQDRSAMNNLVVLYQLEGREAEQAYWEDRVRRHRERNPFYHTWRGDKAGESGDLAEALVHYEKALSLRPEDSRMLYAVGLLHFQLKHYEIADDYISQAIEGAHLMTDKETYRLQLRAVREEQLAGS
ncbi:MAG: tetratricopeptide repeat protein [Pseudomonadota bacterium]